METNVTVGKLDLSVTSIRRYVTLSWDRVGGKERRRARFSALACSIRATVALLIAI